LAVDLGALEALAVGMRERDGVIVATLMEEEGGDLRCWGAIEEVWAGQRALDDVDDGDDDGGECRATCRRRCAAL
jgi:hypothetical protein